MTNPHRSSHRRAAIAAIAALLAALIAPTAAPAPARADVPETPRQHQHQCLWALAIARHVVTHQLHSDASNWTLNHRTDFVGMEIPTGLTTSRVEVSDQVPCSIVPSIAEHEWMHQQQMRWFGGRALAQRADMEIMADCGAWMLGSRYTPYIDMARRNGAGCTTAEFAYARAMIEAAGVAVVRQP